MTRKLYLGVAALVSLAAIGAVQAVEPVLVADVEQVSTLNISTQFASMQAELESLRAQVQEISYGGGGQDDCGKCGSAGCNCLCDIGCGGVYAGFELAILKPHFQRGSTTQIVPFQDDSPRFDYQATPRFWLGYQNCEGFGVRARYWQFDHDAFLDEGGGDTDYYSLKMETLDVEATQLVCWGPLQMNFAAGARYARTKALDADTGFGGGYFTQSGSFSGWGPTLALDFRRPIGCSPFAFIGNARGSLLYGNARHTVVNDGVVVDADRHFDTLAQIMESQVGVEYRRCLGSGVLSVRALMEGQMWVNGVDVALDGTDTSRNHSNAGLFGATFGVQYAR